MASGYYSYWAKASPADISEPNHHLLVYHCLDVAAVSYVYLLSHPNLLTTFEKVSRMGESFLNWCTFLQSIHDVGKFADGFQNQRPDIVERLQRRPTPSSYHVRHDTLGYLFCREYIVRCLDSRLDLEELWDLLEPWISSVTGHHGRPPRLEVNLPYVDQFFTSCSSNDALSFIKEAVKMFLPSGFPLEVDSNSYADNYHAYRCLSWWMAGLAVLADWIGSNQRWFPYLDAVMELEGYWEEEALPRARVAVRESGLTPTGIARTTGIRVLFPRIRSATPLQALVEKIIIAAGPHLFVLEELTGGGKTEAALVLAHRLMSAGLAEGLFIALPTMATANAMYGRIHAVYRKLFAGESTPSLILAHSTSPMVLDLEKQYYANNSSGAEDGCTLQECTAWLSDSRKKALLAHVGVGTIDQALLSVLPIRHQSLRLIGLARKVLLVDEVHACDPYVYRLLCTLLRFHAAGGGSAILLSATLPKSMRAELVRSFAKGIGSNNEGSIQSNSYPLVTVLTQKGVREISVSPCKFASRHVDVKPLYELEEVASSLQDALASGGCACWVRNTVYDAVQSYREWVRRLGQDRVLLFHARFALGDRLRLEQRVKDLFGPNSSGVDREGKLLIATQVVEQSLDLDFDFMVTDLAPIDLIIQRAGRLRRHDRGRGGVPLLGIYMPYPESDAPREWYESMFPKAAAVYRHHGQLWLTAKWMSERKGFSMPEDARDMVEYVYGLQYEEMLPDSLKKIEERAKGKDKAEGSLGFLNSLCMEMGYSCDTSNSWSDEEYTPTRLGEPTVTLRLARYEGGRVKPWYAENTGHDWELSQLMIRKSLVNSEDPTALYEAIIHRAKEAMPDKGRYCIVVPIMPLGGKWVGHAIGDGGKPVKLIYDESVGLEIDGG